MTPRRAWMIAGLLALPAAGRAQGQPSLIGTWRGEVVGMQGANQRTMVVASVGADGAVAGRWGGDAFTGGTWRQGELALTTVANSRVTLRLTGPDQLEGSIETGGGRTRRYSLAMQRQR